MSSQITYAVETVASGGQAPGTIATNMAQPSTAGTPGVFRDDAFLNSWGLRASADGVLTAVNTVKRTIVLQMDASAIATAAVNVVGKRVTGLAITSQGLDYVQPPTPVLTDATGAGALFNALGLQILNFTQKVAGNAGYSAATCTVTAVGGLAAGGVPAIIVPTIVAGSITALTISNPTTNGPYGYPPQLRITDSGNPNGGAIWTARMGVFPTIGGVIASTFGGSAPYTAPTVVFAPYFKQLCPDSNATAQAAAVKGFMSAILSAALNSPMAELAPVVA